MRDTAWLHAERAPCAALFLRRLTSFCVIVFHAFYRKSFACFVAPLFAAFFPFDQLAASSSLSPLLLLLLLPPLLPLLLLLRLPLLLPLLPLLPVLPLLRPLLLVLLLLLVLPILPLLLQLLPTTPHHYCFTTTTSTTTSSTTTTTGLLLPLLLLLLPILPLLLPLLLLILLLLLLLLFTSSRSSKKRCRRFSDCPPHLLLRRLVAPIFSPPLITSISFAPTCGADLPRPLAPLPFLLPRRPFVRPTIPHPSATRPARGWHSPPRKLPHSPHATCMPGSPRLLPRWPAGAARVLMFPSCTGDRTRRGSLRRVASILFCSTRICFFLAVVRTLLWRLPNRQEASASLRLLLVFFKCSCSIFRTINRPRARRVRPGSGSEGCNQWCRVVAAAYGLA